MNGIDLKIVQELLGHKSFKMTLRYVYLSPDHKRMVVKQVGNRLQKVVTNWPHDQKPENLENHKMLN